MVHFTRRNVVVPRSRVRVSLFTKAIDLYGLPQKVCTDIGGDNTVVYD